MKDLIKCTKCNLIHTREDRFDKPLNKRDGLQWFDSVCPKCQGKSFRKTKKKCFVITLSKNFLKGHIRQGEPTNFREKLLNGEKVHTIRNNYEYWAAIIEQVKQGIAYISLREWTGKPFISKQVEIKQIHDTDGIDCIAVEKRSNGKVWFYQDEADLFSNFPLKPIGNDNLDLAKNDGLDYADFVSWFKDVEINKPLALIYFSTFRY